MTPVFSCRRVIQIGLQNPRWRTKWRPCKGMAVSQAFYFISSVIAYCISPYASVSAGLSCFDIAMKIKRHTSPAAVQFAESVAEFIDQRAARSSGFGRAEYTSVVCTQQLKKSTCRLKAALLVIEQSLHGIY